MSPSFIMPKDRAIASAVIRWSPVIITGLIPAARHLDTAALASSLGGSIIPVMPKNMRSFSMVSELISSGMESIWAYPIASTLNAWPAISRFALAASSLSLLSSGRAPLLHSILVQHSSSSSSPPFAATRKPPSGSLWTVVISFLCESKGISATRGSKTSSSSLSMPNFSPRSANAVSVGSPRVCSLPSSPEIAVSFASTAERIRSFSAWLTPDPVRSPSAAAMSAAVESSAPAVSSVPAVPSNPGSVRTFPQEYIEVTVILFCVSVPVLSEHMTVVLPRVSTEGRLRTMAFLFASLCTPIASTMVETAGSPSGIAAAASETDVMNIESMSFP